MAIFRTKARAVELLGKGQIADLPTAISELWKNGYDAYGDTLQAFLYERGYRENANPIFVLSDDGKGMSEEDVLDKWFVLGTDSKTRGDADETGPETLFKEPRVKMGEKGIGRLAVAYLGPQMLMITKKMGLPLELVFFDWRILENYNLFLNDVNIPQTSITSIEEFESAFEYLKKDFLKNFPEIPNGVYDPWEEQRFLKESIIKECENLILPEFVSDDVIKDLVASLSNTHATRFIVFQPDYQIINLRNFAKPDSDDDITSSNYAISTLTGLFNLFKTKTPKYQTHFWIYGPDNAARYDLLTLKSFFEPEDFDTSDHLIKGEFNEKGIFEGTVRIYKKEVNHTFDPLRKGKTNYGPFSIKLGYVQQVEEDSSLTEEDKAKFEQKLAIYSGLFIYRDGFRVLPYGRPDTDFLEFEERRSKGAGMYFFSHRRMFGYIEISRNENDRLKDKSSREGFINNQAFRDFKTDLIAFFKDLAKKYFGSKAEESFKRDQQEELKRLSEAEAQEKQRDIDARKDFAKKLKELPKGLEKLQSEYDTYLTQLQEKSNHSDVVYGELQSILTKVEECKVKISDFKLQKPTRFKPTELQTKTYHNYNKSYIQVTKHIDESASVINSVRDKLKVYELFQAFEDQFLVYKNNLTNQFRGYGDQLEEVFKRITDVFQEERGSLLHEFEGKYAAIIPARDNAAEINRSMKVLENIFNDSKERLISRIAPFIEHLARINFNVNEDDLVGFYKWQFEEMKEEWNQTYELAQLGIAVEIIDHQFNALYAQLAENIRSLNQFMIPGPESELKYRNLFTAFEHLQNNYKLLQPIYRTTGRIRRDITGKELKEYTEDFFSERFKDDSIQFKITKEGAEWSQYSYESILKPVVINIINNALYWLRRSESKEVLIDAIGNELLILNSGEQIEDYILEDIFKLFYSKRPNGRGIGLYLAKKSLNGIGLDIYATNEEKYNKLNGACFVIKPITT